MTNFRILLFILAFWLCIPIPCLIMGIGGFEDITKNFNAMEKYTKPTLLDYIFMYIEGISVYFRIAFVWFYGAPLYLNAFFWLLRLMSLIIIFTIK